MLTALACAAGGIAAASILAATGLACVLLSGRISRAEEDQALGVANSGATHKPPAGHAVAPAPQALPPRAAPPGPNHDTGGVLYTIRTWACGCVIAFDGQGHVTGTHRCATGGDLADWDEELKGLTP